MPGKPSRPGPKPEDQALKQRFGEPVPDFELRALDGASVGLATALTARRGAVVVFWSSVCSHCRRYDSYLNSFGTNHSDLVLLAVASRQGEGADQLSHAVAERGLSFPILLDSELTTARQWQVAQTPRTFLVDGERRLLYRGAIDNFRYPEDPDYEAYLEPAIEAFLSGQPIARPETASFGCPVDSVYYDLPRP